MSDHDPIAALQRYSSSPFAYSSSETRHIWTRRPFAPFSTNGIAFYVISRIPDSFSEFESYGLPNWDGEGAEPITRDTVDAARRFNSFLPRELRPADTAPGADGTIGFEWREGPPERRKFIIVEIGPGNIVRARKVAANGTKSRLAPIDVMDSERLRNLTSMLFDATAA
jgi:hypothetical protein